MLDLSSRKVYGALAEQCVGGDAKADKVENATSGHLAGLDANGNLTDSGVSPAEDVTVEGNPVTFESPFEQDAKSVVVSVKPIQDLHGLPFPYVGGAYKNYLGIQDGVSIKDGVTLTPIKDADENNIGINLNGTAENDIDFWRFLPISLPFGVDKYITIGLDEAISGLQMVISPSWAGISTSRVTSDAIQGAYIFISQGTVFDNVNIYPMICLDSETDKSFAPYSNICPISGIDELEIAVSDGEGEPTTTTIPLPSTLYDADVDVTEGSGDSRFGIVDLGDLEWTKITTNVYMAEHSGMKVVGDSETADLKCEIFYPSYYTYLPEGSIAIRRGEEIWVRTFTDDLTEFENLVNGYKLVYPLATPTTLSFDPTDVELLEGTNVVSTNAEKVAVTYGRSLWQDIDKLKTDIEGKLNKSDVADVEGDTASRPYSVNEFMLRADGFYKVTAPIASGASITSSNTTKTTVGEVLTTLLNA